MKRYLTLILSVLLIVSGCKNKDIESLELSPSPDYPYTYTPLNQQEMTQKLQEFNAVNTFQSLKLNEYGMVYGSIPVDVSAGMDSTIIKSTILQMIKTYAPFLGITNSDTIKIETDMRVHLDGGVTIHLSEYFQHTPEVSSTFVLQQNKWKDRKMENSQVSFYYLKENHQMQVSGRWYDKAILPEMAIKDQEDALNMAIQYINENHREVTPLSLSTIRKEAFEKVIFPYSSSKGIEMRECWEVIFWDNSVKVLVDTQTGEVVDYLQYGHMV